MTSFLLLKKVTGMALLRTDYSIARIQLWGVNTLAFSVV